MKNLNKIAFFDFDGTLTTKDTLLPFCLFVVGIKKFLYHLPKIIPIVSMYLFNIIDNAVAKERFLTIILSNIQLNQLELKANLFALNVLNKYINKTVYQKLLHHLNNNDKVVIVSANLAIYLRYWANHHQIHQVIATELEVDNNTVTGKLATANCYGVEKIIRIKAYLEKTKESYDYSYAYGNSRGDYEMLQYANEAYFVRHNILEPVCNLAIDSKKS